MSRTKTGFNFEKKMVLILKKTGFNCEKIGFNSEKNWFLF